MTFNQITALGFVFVAFASGITGNITFAEQATIILLALIYMHVSE